MANKTTSFLYQWRNEPSICDKEMHDKRELNRKKQNMSWSHVSSQSNCIIV